LKLLSFKNMEHIIYKELIYFQKLKKCHLPKQLYAFFITICKNHYSKIHSYEKDFLGQKDM
jgi:hypothetical protein